MILKNKINIQTLGCPKNFSDTQRAEIILEENNYIIVNNPQDAEVIIVNTCGFINDAKKESIERILDMAEIGAGDKKILVSGCLSKRYSDDIFDEMPEVDGFIGVNEYEKLPEIIEAIVERNERVKLVEEEYSEYLPKMSRKPSPDIYSSTIKIGEGCDNVCAYCIIPGIRGKYRSKKMEDILEEAKELAVLGCKELILIAQDVTYYGRDLYGKFMLPQLLRDLCKIEGIQWIRIMYAYEDKITSELIEVMATEEKICNYIDIPLQHSSDRILKSMKRRSTRKSSEYTIRKLREKIPDIHIRTTLIVGFPGEMEEDFNILEEFVEENKFDRLGVFKYSQEEGTVAGTMKNQIPEDIKEERYNAIMRRQIEISLERNREKIGKILQVIVDMKEDENTFIGRTPYDSPDIDNTVIFTSEKQLSKGDMVKVIIEDAFDYDLVGREV